MGVDRPVVVQDGPEPPTVQHRWTQNLESDIQETAERAVASSLLG